MALRIALAQINPTVGDLPGNLELIESSLSELEALAPDLVVFPELVITGYPPEDLLHYPGFIEDAGENIDRLARSRPNLRLLVGAPILEGDDLFNAAVLLHGGARVHLYRKCTLPNYGVFDEKRYFRPGRRCPVYTLGDWKIGVNICEDIWAPHGVPAVQAAAGANLLVNLSSSPYYARKGDERAALIRHRARQHRTFLAYVNLIGGQDELVFDGDSLIVGPDGSILVRGKRFETDHLILDLEPMDAMPGAGPESEFIQPRYEEIDDIEHELRAESIDLGPLGSETRNPLAKPGSIVLQSEEEEVYGALVLGTRDYVRKNGFREVVIGLSGGIDSALTAVIASDALGPESVHGLTMPSLYTSKSSRQGVDDLAGNLGISLLSIPIEQVRLSYLAALRSAIGDGPLGITEENIQARIRGNLLMALSNARGWLVLTTGNKSELAVGYCTLYGDMAGGFAVLKDVPKGLVYRLSHWRNSVARGVGVIPRDTIERPPSAELRPDQEDTDTLPPYPLLDAIVEARVERDELPETLVARGFDPATVELVYAWIDGNEYKRRQAPPGIKITPRAFGKDRRYPITNLYRARP